MTDKHPHIRLVVDRSDCPHRQAGTSLNDALKLHDRFKEEVKADYRPGETRLKDIYAECRRDQKLIDISPILQSVRQAHNVNLNSQGHVVSRLSPYPALPQSSMLDGIMSGGDELYFTPN